MLQIRVLPPSARVEIRNGQFHVEGTLPIYREDSGLSRTAALDGYVDLFREAIASMPDEQAFVPLSGGRDSRHILLELARRRAPGLRALSIEQEAPIVNNDPSIAKRLATLTGISHEIAPAGNQPVRKECLKNSLTQWGTLEHSWLLPAAVRPRPPGTSVYEGVGGDRLSTSWHITPKLLKLLEASKIHDVAADYVPSEHYLASSLPRELYREASREVAIDRIAEEIHRHVSTCNPLGSFHVFNRTRRVTGLSPCSLWRMGGGVWCPYLYGPLFDFLRSIPVAHLLADDHTQFHTDAIARAYPEAADIPYSVTGKRTSPARSFNWLMAMDLGRYAAFHPFRLMKRSFLMPRIARALVDPLYLTSMVSIMPTAVYLLQVEALADGRWDDLGVQSM